MSWFDAVQQQFQKMVAPRASIKATIESPSAWLRAETVGAQYALPDRTLPEAQLELYQRLAWVQIAISNKAAIVATTDMQVLELKLDESAKRHLEERLAISNHPFELLLNKPNPLMSRFEFLEATSSYLDVTGNAYWWLNRSNEDAQPIELWIMPSASVKPIPDERMYIRGYAYEPEGLGRTIVLEPWEVAHFRRWHPRNSFIGLSPIEAFAIEAEGDLAMSRWNTNLFARDNAKSPGALAFADPIDDESWRQMKSDIADEYGGVKRKMMMLRNVGKGGVQWLQMAMSQRDMEFLAGREFTKEQIYAIYAPGLSSMLSVNSTEANSIAGRKTFMELSIWPQLTRIAQKITNDILPIYGDCLVMEPEDVRVTDRSLKLQEQAAFERIATVDEVRAEHYDLPPIGDDRGRLLVTEVGRGWTRTGEPVVPAPLTQTGAPPPRPAIQPDANIDGEKPEPEIEEAPLVKSAEIKALRKWLKKRGAGADLSQFSSKYLQQAEIQAIYADLFGEGGADQPFFPQAGKATRRLPGEDGNDRQRGGLERYHADKLQAAFRKLLRKIVPPGTNEENITPDSAIERYRENEKILRDALVEMLMDGAQLGADTGIAQMETLFGVRKADVIGVNWDLVNEFVLRWVLGESGVYPGYADSINQAMAQTSEKLIRLNMAEWIQNRLPLNVLIDNLERAVFDRDRAELIVTTEITRAYAEGNRAAWKESLVIEQMRWNTSSDERVCPICAPLEGKIAPLTGTFERGRMPPAHPRCRCWITPVIGDL
jgi:HK97 family phage portal protein